MTMYIGDYAEDNSDVNFKFTTRNKQGTPTTLSGAPAVSVFKSNVAGVTSTGVTLTVDFNSVTGLNNVKIDLSADSFYVAGEDYTVVLTAGTVDGINVAGEVLANFSIENRFVGAGSAGAGALETNITVQVSGLPVDGVEVWVTTDTAGSNVVAGALMTDTLGKCTFMLDPGDYYLWRKKAGYNFSNPQAITVS